MSIHTKIIPQYNDLNTYHHTYQYIPSIWHEIQYLPILTHHFTYVIWFPYDIFLSFKIFQRYEPPEFFLQKKSVSWLTLLVKVCTNVINVHKMHTSSSVYNKINCLEQQWSLNFFPLKLPKIEKSVETLVWHSKYSSPWMDVPVNTVLED